MGQTLITATVPQHILPLQGPPSPRDPTACTPVVSGKPHTALSVVNVAGCGVEIFQLLANQD